MVFFCKKNLASERFAGMVLLYMGCGQQINLNYKMMKNLFIALILITAVGACKQKSKLDTNRDMVLLSDPNSSAYNGYSDTGFSSSQQAVSNGIFGVGSNVAGGAVEPAVNEPVRNSAVRSNRTSYPARSTARRSSSGTRSSSGGGGSTASTVPARKKGWSKAAKGAAIGAGAGAVAGAVIGRNAKGAIIGAVLGAGGGYIIGRSKDKKDGRY